MAVLNEIEIDGISYTLFDINKIYPIGSIYMSVNNTNPSALFGGSWERITDRFLLGAGGSYGVGTTGGEASHVLTVDEMPRHLHSGMHWGTSSNAMQFGVNGSGSGFWRFSYSTAASEANFYTGYTGGSAAHNNMPPYLAVYIWKRVS